MFPTETLYPGGYTPGYTGSLCRRISSSVSDIQAGGILTRIPRENRRFRSPDRGIFDINQGGGGDAGFMDHPEGAGSGRGDRVDFDSREQLAGPARGHSEMPGKMDQFANGVVRPHCPTAILDSLRNKGGYF